MTVDKELLFELLLIEPEEVSETHIAELKKVIKIVCLKHYPQHSREFGEIENDIIVKFFQNRVSFNPKYDAYNYIYTMCRNQAGNLLRKVNREILTDEFFSEGEPDEEYQEIESPILEKYYQKLMGTEDWNFVRVPRADVAELLLFFSRFKSKPLPNYLNIKGVAERLYYIVSKLIEDKNQ